MNNKTVFLDHIRSRTPALYYDIITLRNLISDIFSNNKILCNTLKIAVESGASIKLADSSRLDVSRQSLEITKIIHSLTEEYGLEKKHATEAIHVLAYGLGIQSDVSSGSFKNGNIVSFGGFDWRIMEVQDRKILILCEYVIEKMNYHTELKNITWADCALRQYLNDDFYNKFQPFEKEHIIKTTLSTSDNIWYGSDGGTDTTDNIFLLSIEEALIYFGNSGIYLKYCKPNDQGFVDDGYNSLRLAKDLTGSSASWWLRSPGLDNSHAVSVWGGGKFLGGKISVRGDIVDSNIGGVRPALWKSF